MKYYIGDTHLDHDNVITLCDRPFRSTKVMQDEIIGKWNAKVENTDDVYVVGDFCFKASNFVEFAHSLNGQIHFIPGNHDHKAFKQAQSMLSKFRRFQFHEQIFITKDYDLNNNEVHVVLSHYPIYEWPHFYKSSYHIHGHTHGTIGASFKTRAFDVGVDVTDFQPVTLHEILLANGSPSAKTNNRRS